MKTLVALFTFTFALLLMSCSNIDQDLSPVGPDVEKISTLDVQSTYPYLTLFNSVQVESFTIIPGDDAIDIVVGGRGWADNLEHIYVMLEYAADTYPSADKMVYLEKPRSVTFRLKGFKTDGLKDVKVYCYEPFTDPGIKHPYFPLQSFNNTEMQWYSSENEIQILLYDTFRNLGDSFAQITTTEGSFVLFLDKPTIKEILIPKNAKTEVTGVKLYSMLD